jgi:hypothetical protein
MLQLDVKREPETLQEFLAGYRDTEPAEGCEPDRQGSDVPPAKGIVRATDRRRAGGLSASDGLQPPAPSRNRQLSPSPKRNVILEPTVGKATF